MVQVAENRYNVSVYSGYGDDVGVIMAFYIVDYNGYTVAAGGPYDTETEAQREAEIAMRDHAAARMRKLS